MRNKDKKPLTRRGMCKRCYKFVKDDPRLWTAESLEELLRGLENCLGVPGTILVPFIGAEIEDIKKYSAYRNRRSQRLFVKWLLSEARNYADFGSLNPYVNAICKYSFKIWLERSKKEAEVEDDR